MAEAAGDAVLAALEQLARLRAGDLGGQVTTLGEGRPASLGSNVGHSSDNNAWLGALPAGSALPEQVAGRVLDGGLRQQDRAGGVTEWHEAVVAGDPGDATGESRVDQRGDDAF